MTAAYLIQYTGSKTLDKLRSLLGSYTMAQREKPGARSVMLLVEVNADVRYREFCLTAFSWKSAHVKLCIRLRT